MSIATMDMTGASIRFGSLEEKMRHDQRQSMLEREQAQNAERNRLRDFAVQLREPQAHYAKAPASENIPSFKLGDTPNFHGALENRAERPGMGHLSPPAYQDFMQHMRAASVAPDVRSREAHTEKAAQVVAQDYLQGKGLANLTGEEVRRGVLHQMRSQIVMNMRSLGQSLGLTTTTSHVISFGLERALETKGFTVLANRAIDRIADVASRAAGNAKDAVVKLASAAPDAYRPSAAGAAAATGVRHSLQQTLHTSMNRLNELGVNRESLKGFMTQHMGKIMVMMEVAQHPAAFQRAAQLIAQSPTAMEAVYSVVTDKELRHATGNLLVAAGDSAGGRIWRGAGSMAVVAGSVMRGDSKAEIGRHVFRSLMAVAGGALGAVAGTFLGGPVGSVALGFAGAEGGAMFADEMLAYWDRKTGHTPPQQNLVSAQELQQSQEILARRGSVAAQGLALGITQGLGLGETARQVVERPPAGNWVPGQTSREFESGNGGPGTVSSGRGDHGGASYGTYQLSSRQGTLQEFLKSSGYDQQFAGLRPGSSEFNARWKEVAISDSRFGDAQHAFIQKTHYDPAMAGLKQAGIDFSDRGPAVQDAVWSTATQFGAGNAQRGAIGMIQRALSGKDVAAMSDREIVTAIQDYKIAHNDRLFASSSAEVRAGTANRAVLEKERLVSLADQPGGSNQVAARDTGREMERTYGGGRGLG